MTVCDVLAVVLATDAESCVATVPYDTTSVLERFVTILMVAVVLVFAETELLVISKGIDCVVTVTDALCAEALPAASRAATAYVYVVLADRLESVKRFPAAVATLRPLR